MGKSWKEKPGKYRNNRDFQKKQKQKHGHKPQEADKPYSPFDDPPEYHESFS